MNSLPFGLDKKLSWGEPRETITSRGPALVRDAEANAAFWAVWRNNKAQLNAAGISLPPKRGDVWMVRWYQNADGQVYQNAGGNVAVLPQPAAVVLPSAREIVFSAQQTAVFSWYARKDPNANKYLVVQARAGTGKTFTTKEAFKHAPEHRIIYMVFNRKNRREAQDKISDPRVDIHTINSAGYMIVKSVWPNAKPDDTVERERIRTAMGCDDSTRAAEVYKLVGFVKNMLIDPTLDSVAELALSRMEIEGSDDTVRNYARELAKLALKVCELSKVRDEQNRISFNDQVWLPVVMSWVNPMFQLVVVDEFQDTNAVQIEFIRRIAADRICVVGDNCQAIYGFRGAVQNAMGRIRDELNAELLPLSETYRCPKAVVAAVHRLLVTTNILPELADYTATPNAPEGIVTDCSEDTMTKQVAVGDAILSRTNAPLMPVCFGLLRSGIPARIEGKDVGKQLLALIKKLNARSVADFIVKAKNWKAKQCKRNADDEAHCAEICDTADTLVALAEDMPSVSAIKARIETLFTNSDEDKRPMVVLSSTHKAKGLEWHNVYLLNSTYKPTKGEEEAYLYYVAMTRAQSKLTFVN